ncbi:hypothetical protein ElyMa_001083700 [Elysia marginata]|uniref:Uncharacterized protein n=1 Tax=Elysia marginata TaxID=1093978 RepID=A0AAV4HWP8_9GAST|nr:hypothetical protein ElyMa_001083700 [Elysia marginata]
MSTFTFARMDQDHSPSGVSSAPTDYLHSCNFRVTSVYADTEQGQKVTPFCVDRYITDLVVVSWIVSMRSFCRRGHSNAADDGSEDDDDGVDDDDDDHNLYTSLPLHSVPFK